MNVAIVARVNMDTERGGSDVRIGIRLVVAGLLTAAIAVPAAVRAQAKQMTPEEKAAETARLAKLSQNPVGNLISVPFQLNNNYNVGDSGRTQSILNIQPVIPFHLNPKWNLITRTIIPVIWQPDNASSGTTTGVGDINLSLFLSPAAPGKVIWGVGAALAFPTGSPADLSAGKWTAGPSFVVLTMPGPWVVGLLANNTWSYTGWSDRPAVSLFYSQVFLNYNFKKTGWYLTTAPVITANWMAASAGDVWTVPLGGGGGKLVRLGKLPLNCNVSYYGYVTKPTGGPNSTLRVQVAVLLPKG